MARWLALSVALVIAASALYFLARGGASHPRVTPPLDAIDDESRARLERVLREAESREAR